MLGPEFVKEIVYPKIPEIISALQILINKNQDDVKDYLGKKYSTKENKITNNVNVNFSNTKLSEVFQRSLHFSQTMHINDFNYDLLGTVVSTNRSKFGEEGKDSEINDKEREDNLRNPIIELLNGIRKGFENNISTINSVSFVYYSLKVSF